MLGISADTWGALGAVAGGIGTIVAIVYGRIAAADKKAHDLEMAAQSNAIADQAEAFSKEVEALGKDIARVETSLTKAWTYVDDLRINAVRRADQDRLREEFRADVKALGDRLIAEITNLRNDIHLKPGGA